MYYACMVSDIIDLKYIQNYAGDIFNVTLVFKNIKLIIACG